MISRWYPTRMVFGIWAICLAIPGVASAGAPSSDGGAISAETRIALGLVDIRVENKSFLTSAEYIRQAVEGLAQTDGYAVLSHAEGQDRMRAALFANGERDKARLDEIEGALSDGEELLYTDPGKAIDILRAAISEIRKDIERFSMTEAARKSFFRAQMLLARSYYDNGNTDRASTVLEETILLFGGETLNTDAYHPQMVKLYNQALKKLEPQKKGVLRVQSDVEGAKIFIDGKKQAQVTPAEFSTIFKGEHHVQVRTETSKSRVHRVQVELGSPSMLKVSMGCDRALSWGSDGLTFFFTNTTDLTDNVRAYSALVAGWLGVRQIVVMGLVPHKKGAAFLGYVVESGTGRLLQSETILVNPDTVDPSAVERMIEGLSGKGFGTRSAAKKDYFGSQGPWYKQWPGWVLAGVGVASSVMAGVYYAEFDEKKGHAEDAQFHIDDPDTGNKARESEGNQALRAQKAAWATGIIGVLSLAGAATFFALHATHEPADSAGTHAPENFDGLRWSLVPGLAPGAVHLGVGGSF